MLDFIARRDDHVIRNDVHAHDVGERLFISLLHDFACRTYSERHAHEPFPAPWRVECT